MAATDDSANRPKRVRTGCLTCRERHLKCDEGLPDCQNCRKSGRICKRGVRLNFIDTQVKPIPTIPRTNEWCVSFQDESREIASDYAGGAARYAAFASGKNTPPSLRKPPENTLGTSATMPLPSSQTLPSILSLSSSEPSAAGFEDRQGREHHNTTSFGQLSAAGLSPITSTAVSTNHSVVQRSSPKPPLRTLFGNQEKTLFMQVFVEEVGLWMDSLDSSKHFSRLLPFTALEEPMLLSAFLACGARHLTLVNPTLYKEDKALNYYDTATRLLLNALQDLKNRNMVTCATTAVILNVYEIMSERATQRMNHIAGARALIEECGWNARSPGIGGACFWLNVSMELLSCLHVNWCLARNPDDWGVDMSLDLEPSISGREEEWAHKIVYILAKIANFRATIKPFGSYDMQNKRYEEWKHLHNLCLAWNDAIPRSMHPIAYLYPYQTTHKSAFPEVWLIKRCTIVARMFFHTAMVLLAGMNPTMPRSSVEMSEMAMQHAHQICGITAHVKDRGVASVALRSLAIAAECLTNRREQEEVLQIFQKIKRETGWRVDFLQKELKQTWGWEETMATAPPTTLADSTLLAATTATPEFSTFQTSHLPAPYSNSQTQSQQSQYSQTRRLPQVVNPLMAVGDLANGHSFHPQFVPIPGQQVGRHHQFMVGNLR